MKLSIPREALRVTLPVIQAICEKSSTTPVLSHFLLQAKAGQTFFIATDLRISIKMPVTAEVIAPGDLCIPAKKLLEITKEADTEQIGFESIEGKENWLKLTFGNSSFKLAGLPATDFPSWPTFGEQHTVIFPAKDLVEMLDKSLYAAGESDTRYTLNGILMHLRPSQHEITLVGTDGHRLATVKRKNETLQGEDSQTILPRKAAQEMGKILNGADVACSFGEKHIEFKTADGVSFIARKLEGTYPDYLHVIPQSNPNSAMIEKESFFKSLKKVSIMSKERGSMVRCTISEDKLRISSADPDLGEASDEISIDYHGPETTIGFNARYLMDALSSMVLEKVRIAFDGSLSPVLVTEGDYHDTDCKAVVMPLRT